MPKDSPNAKTSLKRLRQSLRTKPSTMINLMKQNGITEEPAAAKFFEDYWAKSMRANPRVRSMIDHSEVSANDNAF